MRSKQTLMDISKRRACAWLIHLFCALLGAMLLATAVSLQTPWQPSHLQCSGMVWEAMHVGFPGTDLGFDASGLLLLCALVILMVLLGVCTGAFRSIVQKSGYMRFILVVGLFSLPLIPTREGLPIIMQLAFASTGMLWLVFGLWPVIEWIERRWPFISRGCSAVATCFLNMRSAWFVALVFGVTFGLTNYISWRVFEHVPHIQDNVDQLFHAKIFASGNLKVSSPLLREFFEQQHMINNGSWYSQYPPGHTFLLMLGVFLGVPWVVNPLMGAGTVVMFYFNGRKMFGETVGRLAA